jgi:hypothetical protein
MIVREYWQQRGPIYSVGRGHSTFPEARKTPWHKFAMSSDCICHRPKGFDGEIKSVRRAVSRLKMVRMYVNLRHLKPSG